MQEPTAERGVGRSWRTPAVDLRGNEITEVRRSGGKSAPLGFHMLDFFFVFWTFNSATPLCRDTVRK